MAIDEEMSTLRTKLEEDYGVRGAAILMDRPPGGWNDLVTNASLQRELSALEGRLDLKLAAVDAKFAKVDARFDALESRMDARFADVDHRFERFEHQLLAMVDRRLRQQAWVTLSSVIAAMGIIVTALKV
jgi:hypothetical protein